ncbi:uncharacterized protein LOC133806481 [Humulus lupulus]|uniref:uncharacterized protein LOC133806481 n=1 Tax=Humulus lupulus TaxID=3486 RepID=UPI002B412A65|nr:uncharacterized protein LOC133806481 [Humulus lupulus]
MTWADFIQAFGNKYYSTVVLATRVDEFVTLVQGNLSVTDYAQKFDRLARFGPEIVRTEAIRVQRFMRELKPMVARDVKMTRVEVVSYAKVLNKAHEAEYLEVCIWKDNVARREANRNKGFHEGNKRKAHEGQSSGNDKRPRPLATNDNNHKNHNHHNNRNSHNNDRNCGNHQENKVECPSCPKCSRQHLGECQADTNKCYKCGQTSHLKKDCSQWKAGQGSNSNLVPTSVFALTQKEATNSNTMVTSQLPISGMICRVLIDSGATHSYVAMNVIDKLRLPCKLFERSFSIMLPSGDIMSSARWLQSASIIVEGKECPADLIELDIPDYDTILGMDWLAKYRAMIDCRQNTVEFRPKDGELFSFKGKVVGFCMPIITALSTQNMM